MENNCFLSFYSRNNTDNSDVKITTVARYKYSKDRQAVTFEEKEGDLGKCKTTVTVSNGKIVTVERDGPFGAFITAQKNKRTISQHSTPFGSFSLGITLKEFDSNLDESGGTLNFGYITDSDLSIVSDIDFKLKIKTKH